MEPDIDIELIEYNIRENINEMLEHAFITDTKFLAHSMCDNDGKEMQVQVIITRDKWELM